VADMLAIAPICSRLITLNCPSCIHKHWQTILQCWSNFSQLHNWLFIWSLNCFWPLGSKQYNSTHKGVHWCFAKWLGGVCMAQDQQRNPSVGRYKSLPFHLNLSYSMNHFYFAGQTLLQLWRTLRFLAPVAKGSSATPATLFDQIPERYVASLMCRFSWPNADWMH
jgi:hypothetical protein